MTNDRSPATLDHKKFQDLIVRKWKVSLTLAAILLIAYYGFILVLAFASDLLAVKVGEHMTLGIPVGILLIVLAWVLTGVYVFWANSSYDKSVQDVLKSMRRQ
ncbi:Uncharacterized membrane protein, DUF485 family [Desulfonatronum thiosulfatophilum]|uniref:Uncharacterized membrane protein, DUF485 family n=1 Tax=Desulfonatronum thiosulfatophilum TaxID=617002 RepID=A0A1G6DPY0_9BACT|nr:DUF485 domain-containing protein [Desulfonatronum thiosulfatophilum]SDB47199.1 Uncharacterized membrane protein, DUF485 family [Desulfonatronum thiosulfatophilum]